MSATQDQADHTLEHGLRHWLHEEAPDGASRALVERVVRTATAGAQRRTWRDALRMPERSRRMRTATLVLVSILVPAVITGMLLSTAPAGPAVAPSPGTSGCRGSTSAAPAGASSLVGQLHVGRANHTATSLGDCRVLIVGGSTEHDEASSSVELWDGATGSVTELAPMANARTVHAATRLEDGRVLVVGGIERGPHGEILGPAMTAEVWDPTTMTFSDAGTADGPFAIPTATLLADGRVLVLGGGPGRTSALVWDPATGSFEPTGSLHEGRAGGQTTTLLPDGTVLVIGGFLVSIDEQARANVTALASVEVWDPRTGRFHEAPPMPDGRYDHTTTLLPDGRIVVAGGMVAVPGDPLRQETSASVLVRDTVSGVFHTAGSMTVPRSSHGADLLAGGRVLVIGGDVLPGAATAEEWDAASGGGSAVAPPSTRMSGVATHLPDGTLLLSGGWLPSASPDDDGPPDLALDLEVYDPTP